MVESELRRLERVQVAGLFGLYDHDIPLSDPDHVTILHGANGVGKTTVLKMIDSLLRGDLTYFPSIPFGALWLSFQDGRALGIQPCKSRTNASVELMSWMDGKLASSDVVDLPEVGRREDWANLPAEAEGAQVEHPTWYSELQATVATRLIGTGRLEHRQAQASFADLFDELAMRVRGETVPRIVAATSPVKECAQDLQARLRDTMASYGLQSQLLDQSFPQRLLQAKKVHRAVDEVELRSKLDCLTELRTRLAGVGVLEEALPDPFGDGVSDVADPTQLLVMSLYVEDTTKKLSLLEDVANRMRVLRDSLNAKFRHKRVRFDKDAGIVVESEGGPIDLDALSSGEQHELLLHYSLLFNVEPNTVVLIDEPELSLHVAWQKRFLNDLLRIGELCGFDALIATHSPYIAGGRTDLMVELGNAD